jgi:hypothetical protein
MSEKKAGAVAVLTPLEAQDLLRHCLQNGGEVRPSRHFLDELAEEELNLLDALHVLRTGRVSDGPEPDIKSGEWKYRIEGHEPDGKWLIIVFCFKTIDRALLVTVWSVESRRRA